MIEIVVRPDLTLYLTTYGITGIPPVGFVPGDLPWGPAALPQPPQGPVPCLGRIGVRNGHMTSYVNLGGGQSARCEINAPDLPGRNELGFRWGKITIHVPRSSLMTMITDQDEFVQAIEPWSDWALRAVETWFAHYGRVPLSVEPDPVARAELTGRLRRQGRLTHPIVITHQKLAFDTCCESNVCRTPHYYLSWTVAKHLYTTRHLAREFGVSPRALGAQRRFVDVLEELGH